MKLLSRFIYIFLVLLMCEVLLLGCKQEYLPPKLDTPSVDVFPGTYETYRDVVISGLTGSTIIYSLDGTDPDPSSLTSFLAISPVTIHIEKSLVIKAMASKDSYNNSDIVAYSYTISGYKYFVAGHVYGRHGSYETQFGIHPEFKNNKSGFPRIISDSSIKMGFFVEDSLAISSEVECCELENDIALLKKPVYLAPGNHDYSPDSSLFISHFCRDGKTFFSFVYEHSLFIILDSQLAPWNINNDQLKWFKGLLQGNLSDIDSINLFTGKVLWASNVHYTNMNVNWREWESMQINFWPVIVPLIEETKKKTFIFAGDVCAFDGGAFMTDTFGLITLFATGMGGGLNEDHYLIVTVNPDGSSSYEIVPIYDEDTVDSIRKWKKEY